MAAFNEYSERFLEIIDELEYSDYKVWNEVKSLSKATMSKIRRGVCGVSMNALSDFIEQYPEVNADYIITGRGSKFNNEKPSTEDTCVECENLRVEIKNLKSKYNTLEIKYQSLLNAPKEDSEKKLLTVETSFYKETAEKLFWEVLSLKEKIEELEGGSNQKTAEV